MSIPQLVNLLMILLVAVATTGAGRALHESMEHDHSDHPPQAAAYVESDHCDHSIQPHTAVPVAPHHEPTTPGADPHDAPLGHVNCQTCILLAGTMAFVLVLVLATLVSVVTTWTRQRVLCGFVSRLALPCLTNRGPPALA